MANPLGPSYFYPEGLDPDADQHDIERPDVARPFTADDFYTQRSNQLYGGSGVESLRDVGTPEPILTRLGKFSKKLGKDFLTSLNVFERDIPLRTRAGRAFNIAAFAIPPLRVARAAPLLARAAVRGLEAAALTGVGAAIEGRPIGAAAQTGGAFGAGLETALTLLSRGRARLRSNPAAFLDDAAMRDLSRSPINTGRWAVVGAAKTGADFKLSDAENLARHARLGDDIRRLGYDPIESRGFGDHQSAPEPVWLTPGMTRRDAIELGRKYEQGAILTDDGLLDFYKGTLSPLDRSKTRVDDPGIESYYTQLPNGQKFSVGFGDDISIDPKRAADVSATGLTRYDLPEQSPKWSMESRLRDWYTKAVRFVHGMEHYEDVTGLVRAIPEDKLPSKLAQLDATGMADQAVRFGGLTDLRDRSGKVLAPSFQDILKRNNVGPESLDLLNDYGAAKRLLADDDLNIAKGGTPGAGLPDDMPREALEAIVAKASVEAPGVVAAHREFTNHFTARLRNWMVESGLYSPDEVELIIRETPEYVPLLSARLPDKVVERAGTPSDLFFVDRPVRFAGEKWQGPFRPWVETAVRDTYEWANVIKRQQVSKSFIESWMSLDPSVAERFATMVKRAPANVTDATELRQVIGTLRAPKGRDAPQLLTAVVNGERVWAKLANTPEGEGLWEMFHALNPKQVGTVLSIFGRVAAILRAGATLSFEFMARNPLRDVFFGKVTAGQPIRDFVGGFANAVKMGDLFDTAQRSGVFRSELVANDVNQARQALHALVGKQGAGQKVLNVVKSPIEALQGLSMMLERGTRLGRFNRVMQEELRKGTPARLATQRAALEARNISVDFGMYGSRTTPLRMSTAFWNATIQGYDRLWRSFQKNPQATTLRAIGYITLPSIMLYLHNRNDPEYKELPRWERTMFWHIKVGDHWLRFPKPFELRAIFGTSVERFLEAADQIDPKRVDSFAADMLERTATDLLPLPTAARPLVENLINFSLLRNRPVEARGLQEVAPGMRTQPGTSEVAKQFGRMFGVSPVKLDNALFGYTAGLGRLFIGDFGDVVGQAMRGELNLKDAPSLDPRDIPGVRGLTSQFPRMSESVDDFYRFADEVREADRTAAFLERTLQFDDMTDWIEQKATLMGAGPLVQDVTSALRSLREQRDIILGDKMMAPVTRRALLDDVDRNMLNLVQSLGSIVAQFEEEGR